MESNVTAVFDHVSAANDAQRALVDAGFDSGSVRVFPALTEAARHRLLHAPADGQERGLTTPQNGMGLGFVAGFFAGGGLGLWLASGTLNLMGKGPAMAAGPFLSTLIGAVVVGALGALTGYVFNAPLPRAEGGKPVADGSSDASIIAQEARDTPHPAWEHLGGRPSLDATIVTVRLESGRAEEARAILSGIGSHRSVSVWHRTGGRWEPNGHAAA